jgi:hypothetical protein
MGLKKGHFIGLLTLLILSGLPVNCQTPSDGTFTREIEINIIEPQTGAVFPLGKNVKFAIRPLVDLSTITPPVRFRCRSSVDGDITDRVERTGLTGYIDTEGLSPGKHTITFVLKDSAGNVGRGSVSIRFISPEAVEKALEVLKSEEAAPVRKAIKEKLEVSGELPRVALRTAARRYVIDKATSDVRRSAIEIKLRDAAAEADTEEGAMAPSMGKAIRRIAIKEYLGYMRGEAPPGIVAMDLEEDEETLGTYLSIETDAADIDWTLIKLEFDPDEVRARGLDRKRLYIKWFNDDPGLPRYRKWVRLRKGNPWFVNDVGIDTENNVVWANVSHLSVYGIAGSITKAPVPEETAAPAGTPRIQETRSPETTPSSRPARDGEKQACGPGVLLIIGVLPQLVRRIFVTPNVTKKL